MALPRALIFSLLVFSTTSVLTNAATYTLPHTAPAPAPAPVHHRRSNHHRHRINLTPPPAYSPTPTYPSKPPTQPPLRPPTKPPTYPPPTPPTMPPTYPPLKPPITPPVKPPASRQAKPPSYPHYPPTTRKLVAVQGVIYCKNCTYAGINTLVGARPIEGAHAELRCRNTKYLMRAIAKTDRHGYFYLEAPPQITTFGAHKCRVFLDPNPKHGGPCGKPTDLNGGATGSFLVLDKKSLSSQNTTSKYAVYNVGPFAYEPLPCNKL